MAVVKRGPLSSLVPLPAQLQTITLGEGANPYEALYGVVTGAVAPVFDAWSEMAGKGEGEGKERGGVPAAKRKIAELSLSLLSLQQNVSIPDPHLVIHPSIRNAIAAARAQSRRAFPDDLGAAVSDAAFLNRLQADVNSWVREIQKVTRLDRDPAQGSAAQEISFWLSMERALASIEAMLRSDEVLLTLDVLKNAKRFHATVGFLSDTGLKEAVDRVGRICNPFMKEFPLSDLLSATDVAKAEEAVEAIFNHINKKIRIAPYPTKRALALVEAVSRDFNDALVRILGAHRLLYLPYPDFDAATAGCDALFRTWDDQSKDFVSIARDLQRKRGEKFVPMKIAPAHARLQERIGYLRSFRRQHEELARTVVGVMKGEGGGLAGEDAAEDINAAYELVRSVDVLDVSPEGTDTWVSAETMYNERISRVENAIIVSLRDRLATCKNANEMFRVFGKFNALFVRPKIRGAIQEYQAQLIENVKEDISKLHEKFKQHYRNSTAYVMSGVRDVPPVAGAIIWARQIERQLAGYMKRVEDVLGKGWELYAEGQKLAGESSSFQKKLDTRPIFEAWLAEVQKKERETRIGGRLFDIVRTRTIGSDGEPGDGAGIQQVLRLVVNFDQSLVGMFKEVRNMLWLGFSVPHTVSQLARDVRRIYPYAVAVTEVVRTYARSCDEIARPANAGVPALVAGYKKDVQQAVSRGMALQWDGFGAFSDHVGPGGDLGRHAAFVRDLAGAVAVFQDKVAAAVEANQVAKQALDELRTCAFSKQAFAGILERVQKQIDHLNLEGYSNLEEWVKTLDSTVKSTLAHRLETAIKAWIAEFQRNGSEDTEADLGRTSSSRRRHARTSMTELLPRNLVLGEAPTLPVLVHEIKIRNQTMFLDPPIENAREKMYQQLHDWLAVVCTLPAIQSSRYELGLDLDGSTKRSSYADVLVDLTDGGLEKAYTAIESKLRDVSEYAKVWLQYQSLWDLDAEQVYASIGDDVALWQQLVTEIKEARSTFDNSETERSFGCILVDYEQVQSKVNAKYDQWQREILNRFGVKLGQAMRDFFQSLSYARAELEQHTTLDGPSTAEAVAFVTAVQELRGKGPQWTKDMDSFRSGQRTLERQRFQFPADWLDVDQLAGEWSAFSEILQRRVASIQTQLATLQSKIVAEDQVVEGKIKAILAEWEKTKPVKGDIKPGAATSSLTIFEGRVNRLKDEYQQLCKAKEALDLEGIMDDRLSPVLEELKDLKAVWAEIGKVWHSVVEIKDTQWASVVPRKIRQQLDNLVNQARELPAKMRTYAAYDYLQEALKGFVKVNAIVADLKSDAMRDRHWRQLFKTLKVDGRVSLADMTLGTIWDLDLRKNEASFKEVILIAQGEMALEEFLRQVRDTWNGYALDLVNYQNKCRLIRGWDELFTKCAENLSSLSAMRHSPYYKVFEEEAVGWEDKLNRIHVLFDLWIDVQRQWVYLEGIFSGSADIKTLLPVESNRFQNINAEFMAVMKKVYKSPFVLDVLNIPSIQKSMERLADLLTKIQKALGEYLERERSAFPRFYFVGDEDLLEIIGNSKDVFRIQKHFAKMFAGVANILVSDEGDSILGMGSREGEVIQFRAPIKLKNYSRINEWLSALESEMRNTLALLLTDAVSDLASIYRSSKGLRSPDFLRWIERYPAQVCLLAVQVLWTQTVETALNSAAPRTAIQVPLEIVDNGLAMLADAVLKDLAVLTRRKSEQIITELVHQRDAIRQQQERGVQGPKDFNWLYFMRFYFNPAAEEPTSRLTIHMADASFGYGYEYLGVPDKLVQTALTDRCYLTLTQALKARMGGSPFGPAGTGKTESVKALGSQFGRFVLVFCCDETFDFQAMGRIFVGLCRVGAWGCFDEFNRLEERIMSAVSQQIQTIQAGLQDGAEIDLIGKSLKVDPSTGIFITMNPGYAGRQNLPDNLKKLFRSIAMTKPDREAIAQVMLFSQGFRAAEMLASKIVPFFNLCQEQLSPQSHYDFGLRALKSVLVSAGNIKRDRLASGGTGALASDPVSEQQVLIQSVHKTIVPKLVADDIPLLESLLDDVFPSVDHAPVDVGVLLTELKRVCAERGFVDGNLWLEKVVQLYQIQLIHHGVMMVGPSGSGKTSAWQVLLAALQKVEGVEGVAHVINPKAMSKEELYGFMDPTTREWTDGLFTHVLRKIVDNVRGESSKRHWIIFDGDVDPEWVENLNSVLDDNKLLTLPNGERLNLPPNVRIMFEVDNLKYATLATVSRCGMVWFSKEVVTPAMMLANYLTTLRNAPLGDVEEERRPSDGAPTESPQLAVQRQCAEIYAPYLAPEGLAAKALEVAEKSDHIMDFTVARALGTLFSLLNKVVRNVLDYNTQHPDFPMGAEQLELYVTKRFVSALAWSFAGDAKAEVRTAIADFIRDSTTLDFPGATAGQSIFDFDVNISTGEWVAWQSRVPTVEIETHQVASADVVIPTVDTVRHEDIIYSWLSEHKPLIMCGPPGSGKTMTLFNALRKLPEMEVVGLNFASATTPELILKTFDQHCEYRKTPTGMVLSPNAIGKWLVFFCDEINLPATDKYGTQRVISFMRQFVESGGFWRASDKSWVRLERIQFVGACNPPTDPGRVPLSHRFLRHAPVIMVDYPGEASLQQIYGAFNRAALKVIPSLRGFGGPVTAAMVEFYQRSQERFTADIQAHYIYSPRELTRWVRGIFETIKPLETLSLEGLVRIWAHEALRLFHDRLVDQDERDWTENLVNDVAAKHFPTADKSQALARPILYSNWLSKHYLPVDREELRDFVRARLKVFYEEELDVPLVLFNDVLEHVLRIDRVFRQVQGHLLLIGVSGSGKTTLSRFVAWMNGLSVFQVKVHNKYSAADFDEDLRTVLRRAGAKGEKICFIMDESNVLDPGFLERMNTLLANGEVPGLFEGDEFNALMTQVKEGSQREGLMLDSADELYRWFTAQVMRNLHVVFTMNPPQSGLASRAATSPALFNRCVLDWFGDWSDQAFYQVGTEFTGALDLDIPTYSAPATFPIAYKDLLMPPTSRSAVTNAFVFIHQSLYDINRRLSRKFGRQNYVTPRHYLDFINHFVKLFNEKREDLEDQQRHLNVGLDRLRETVAKVEELRSELAVKEQELKTKSALAEKTLSKVIDEQERAKEQKAISETIQKTLAEKDAAIRTRRDTVMSDLAKAEPAVIEAQKSVSNIKRQHLVELRAMGSPPAAVQMALGAVCVMLGHPANDWKAVQSVIKREDFITNVVNFDTEKMMTPQLRDQITKNYISDPNFNFETINRASKACGPLAQWVIAQVTYSSIIDQVGPLRQEVSQLETDAASTRSRAATIAKTIADLEASIARSKEEYAALVTEQQVTKAEMDRVTTKVTRSLKLLENLSSEKGRWSATSENFDAQLTTIVGDVILGSAFLAYAGYFDQSYREQLVSLWCDHLEKAGIQFKQDISLSEFLSTAEERLGWVANSLPADDLCTENAIMLKRFNRFPLIIDPTGQATTFLQQEFKARKMTTASFLDDAFVKNLESALRFGNPLLVEDVESYDPIMNPVLNRELRRTGGRVLIRLGSQEIDFSPSFTAFLSTRDPSIDFPPDLSSRVTFVNFTITKASLQSQCLHEVLKSERADIDQKRTDLIKLQGEFQLRLRQLEKSLLQSLNDSKGNILDDDVVMTTLETLKQEAAEVARKMEETDRVMAEVEAVTRIYTPLAQACSAVYFVLEQLGMLNHFYRFDLDYFNGIFHSVLYENKNLDGVKDPKERLAILTTDLFMVTYRRTAVSLLHEDRVAFAVLLSQIVLKGSPDQLEESEMDLFLSSIDSLGTPVTRQGVADLVAILGMDAAHRVPRLSEMPAFKELRDHVRSNGEAWRTAIHSAEAERLVPHCWKGTGTPIDNAFKRVLIVKFLKPDRLVAAVTEFLHVALAGASLNAEVNLQELVLREVKSSTPIAFCSVPGYDASYRVEAFARENGRKLSAVALGSAEGFAASESVILSAARSGDWVLLKNVHLAPQWLGHLEKRLHALKPERDFRLFLTMETNPSIPTNLLRMSRTLMFEPPPGVKASMLDTLAGIHGPRHGRSPAERSRLYFMVAWLHAVLQERLRYSPLGWTKQYEFTDADQDTALACVDYWLDSAAGGRANVPPEKIPWQAIRRLLKETVYGGKIDSEFDQRLLDSLVDELFVPACFELGFKLVRGPAEVAAPEGVKFSELEGWVQTLPPLQPPSWLGLPDSAELVVMANKGNELVRKVRKIASLADDEVVYPNLSVEEGSAVPSSSRTILLVVERWLAALPETLAQLPASKDAAKDPLLRFFARENATARRLLETVRKDVKELAAVCAGTAKGTNRSRSLADSIAKDTIPPHWLAYKVPRSMTLNSFVSDLVRRCGEASRPPSSSARLGGQFFPEALVTATRQLAAQRNGWSVEELELEVGVLAEGAAPPADAFVVEEMKLEGAVWREGAVEPSAEVQTALPPVALRWVRRGKRSDAQQGGSLPVYLNSDRAELLFEARLPTRRMSGVEALQRGIAIVCL
ncbi:dynein heavy chain [Hyaloraphidium curvatum]|nr:dynein heavy chain [Hyaloraphidium curvatum]